MTRLKLVAALTSLALIGVLMTQPTVNDLNLDLPAATQGVPESPVVMRIGVVADIVEADNITVRISGSPVLVRASYLFPSYEPLLGDRVVVYRQDGQWFVLGTMSGPINSVAPNASFEEGTLGGGIPPTSWSVTVISSVAGTPGMEKSIPPIAVQQRGSFVAGIGVASAGVAGQSSCDIFSTPVAAAEGQSWIAAITVVWADIDESFATSISGGGINSINMFVDFRDAGGAVLTSTLMSGISWTASDYGIHYLRPAAGLFAVAPTNTVSVVFRIRFVANMHVNSNTQIFVEDAILRRVS